MKLQPIRRERVIAALIENGTRVGRVEEIASKLNGKIAVATDGTWTVLVSGDHVGVAKRARYAKMVDAPKPDVALSIAASRL